MVMLDLLSGAPAELGENWSTFQSEGTEIWQVFDRSINIFHPSGAAAREIEDADKIIDPTTTAAINRIAFVFMISPLCA
jgi:hypothetical protein